MQSFKDQADITRYEWDRRVHSRYAMAYNSAFKNFQTTASEAEAAEAAKADFFATMVAIMSCSAGIAVLGETWLSRLVVRTGLRTLGVANTRAVADWVREGQKNAVVGFVFGKSTDLLKDAASDKFKKIAASLVQQVADGLTQTDPLNRYIELQNILTAQADRLTEMAWAVEADRGLSITQKATSTAALAQSPFWRLPANMLDMTKLASKIELAFLLNTVLAGDHLRVHFPPDTRIPAQRGADITMMPSDKRYPRSQTAASTPGGIYTTVEVDRPAMAFQDRIDKVHNEIFGSNFYEASWLLRKVLPNQEFGQLAEVQKAEKRINDLSAMTRPKNAMFAAF